ncbi:hypothetical protein NDU88_003595 [Pleurodeles waltl]|uniref:Uncharacterized protein n=1 Tax=Pleurodeles waltl TaxID=8319 RepID=A0AAV7SGD2_PLEWA|nr:hypothetical protein NDU88_003595 [Pleurodeles waltl]
MFGSPRGTQERITSPCIEEHEKVSREIRKTAEQEVGCDVSRGDKEGMRTQRRKRARKRTKTQRRRRARKGTRTKQWRRQGERGMEQKTSCGDQLRGSGDTEGPAMSQEGCDYFRYVSYDAGIKMGGNSREGLGRNRSEFRAIVNERIQQALRLLKEVGGLDMLAPGALESARPSRWAAVGYDVFTTAQ